MKTDVLIIGGGPAGLSSAISAAKLGVKVTIIEREKRLGGILNQCIHNGFGLHYFGVELTGPEYAQRFIDMLPNYKNITAYCNSSVNKVEKLENGHFLITIQGPQGIINYESNSVIMTVGCRERPAGAINLCGNRVAGIYSAGTAQALVNIYGKMIGKNVVILGSGDIGLIMARRLTCEGANVLGVYEVISNCGGLARNVTQCLQDFNIPLHLSTTVTRVVGQKRVEGVYVAPVENGKTNYSKEHFIKCDTLLLSVGLIPEIELVQNLNLETLPATNSYAVDEYLQSSIDGFFIAGNVLHVNDLVDNVTNEGERAGMYAAIYAKNALHRGKKIEISHDEHIKYTSPKYVYEGGEGETSISFRVDKAYKRVAIKILSNNNFILNKPAPAVNAGELQVIKVDKSKIEKNLTVLIEPL